MKKILIVQGNTKTTSFCSAIADEYEKGASGSGFETRRIDIGKLKFDPILLEGYSKRQELEEDLIKAQEDIRWCTHLVLIYPTWWGYMPAALKGFFDRALLPGFGFKYRKNSILWDKLLKGRSARIITTTGGPKWYYDFVLFGGGARVAKKIVLEFCGFTPVKVTQIPSAERMSGRKRSRWLEKVKKNGMKGN
ncbi:NAD(P)H-dependent oxidoreductase [Candidatus Woesearchaeota archaeon]|nr:NAD(P)H-dependent oxidoreductase [Candidatus Woesearchaeota archaeon]